MEDLQGETTYNLLLLYWERITDEKQTRDQFNKCKCKNCFPIPKLKFSYNYYLYKCELFISCLIRNLFSLLDKFPYKHRILHELSFDINIYETSLGHVVKRASDKLFDTSWTSFINVYNRIKTTVQKVQTRH